MNKTQTCKIKNLDLQKSKPAVLQQQGLLKCNANSTVNTTHFKSEEAVIREAENKTQVPSKLYHAATDNTSSSTKNLSFLHV